MAKGRKTGGRRKGTPVSWWYTRVGRSGPGYSSIWTYSKVTPLATLRVQRQSPQPGEMEWVILEPCRVCDPPLITEDPS
jgi:hypothetical protein